MRTFTISLDEVFPLIDEQRRLYEELGFKICPEDGGVDTDDRSGPVDECHVSQDDRRIADLHVPRRRLRKLLG